MKMVNKFGVLCAILLILLSGCGKIQDDNLTDKSAEVKEEKEPITITFAHPGSTLDNEILEERIALFEKENPDIKVENQYIVGDYITNYITMFAGGTAADVLWLAEDVHTFSSKGQLLALDEYLEKAEVDLTERNGKEYVSMYSYDGKIYGLPDRSGSMVVYYNKTLFDEAGIGYPSSEWTWEDMLNAAKALTKGDGREEQWGFALEYWHPYWMNWCYQNGGKVVDAEGNIAINSEENIEALTFMQELLTVHDVVPSRTEIMDFGSGATASTMFAQGKIGFIMNGLWTAAALQDVDFEWAITDMWKEKEAVTCPFGSALAIASTSEYPEEAFRFINFMNDTDSQRIIAEREQDVPANIIVKNEVLKKDMEWSGTKLDLDVFNRQKVFELPMTPEWASWNTIWSDGLAGVYDGTVKPEDALKEIEEKMTE